MSNFLKKAFEDMKESAKAQHEEDKANFEAAKAEAKAQWEEAKAQSKPEVRKAAEQAKRDEAISQAKERTAQSGTDRRCKERQGRLKYFVRPECKDVCSGLNFCRFFAERPKCKQNFNIYML